MTVLMATLTLLALSAAPDYQKLADDAKWDWRDSDASVLYSMLNCNCDYQIELIKRPKTRRYRGLTLRFTKDGKEAFVFEHIVEHTVFVVKDHILYYAEYNRISTGCNVVAVDLTNGKQLWKTGLKGLGPINHSSYSNAVALELVEGAVKVLGHESKGDYIEFVEMKEGKTVGNKVFKR